jgi:hypothetical protein
VHVHVSASAFQIRSSGLYGRRLTLVPLSLSAA